MQEPQKGELAAKVWRRKGRYAAAAFLGTLLRKSKQPSLSVGSSRAHISNQTLQLCGKVVTAFNSNPEQRDGRCT